MLSSSLLPDQQNNMPKALPGQFLARGHFSRKTGAGVRFFAGDGVAPEVANRIQAYFDQPWYTILSALPSGKDGLQKPFLQELRERKYDLASLEFSVFLKSAGRKVAREPSRIRQVPGLLHARWAAIEYDTPDICSCWHRPCAGADSRLFQTMLSQATCTEAEALKMALPDWTRAPGMLERLQRFGFDTRTIRFRVRSALPLHPDDVPPPPDETLYTLHEDACPEFKAKCPVCGAARGQACSVDDPDREGLGIELGNQVHRVRLAR